MKSFIIYLPDYETSRIPALKLKAQLEEFGMPVELFEGTKGSEAIKEYKKNNRRAHAWSFKGPERLMSDEERDGLATPGIIGCFDSHYRLWEKCIELDESILIFEDDVILTRKFHEVEWDEVLSVAFSHKKKMIRYEHFLLNPSGEPEAVEYKKASMPGNGGYAIKPSAAKKLVEEYKNSFLPADNAINQHVVKIQIHNYMMGRAMFKTEGNISLIRTNIWGKE